MELPQSFTVLDSVELHKTDDDNVFVCHVTGLSDALQSEMREKLVSVCLGLAKAERNLPSSSYSRTLEEFLIRYRTKPANTKKGMIGEFLAHILIRHLLDNFSPVSPFFNMEERSIKKAFDIVFRCNETGGIWLTEVKAGNKRAQTIKQKNYNLLNLAKRSLRAQMMGDENHVWYNAMNGAQISIQENSVRDEIERILDDYLVRAQDGVIATEDFNVVLTSVVYANDDELIVLNDLEQKKIDIENENFFNAVIVFSIQKETYQAVEQFLQSEVP
ncbi:hypothetical protein [Terasakiella pusilla]|uniref:hypothetical protein n=1 Tax=Terasakiella pusilla TaxID=64973 RepID=UPI003AA93049